MSATRAARRSPSRFAYTHRGHALGRSVAQLRARPIASAITLLVLGITLALPTLVLFTADALQRIAPAATARESLTVYLSLETPDLEGAALAARLQGRDDVEAARYLSRDEALATFRENADVGAAIDALGANPLPGAILVRPATDASEAVEALADALDATPGIERVQYDLRWVQRLEALLALLRVAGVMLGGFLTLTALLVIGNTLRLELSRRQAEREVSELLGAGSIFLNRPIVYTGLIYGLLGGIVALVLALVAQLLLKGPIDELAGLYGSDFSLPWPAPPKLLLVPAIGTVLGLIGSIVALYGPSRQLSGQNRVT